MFSKVTIAIISSLICGITQAGPKVQNVKIVAPEVIPVEINGITTPSMIPVDVMNPVELVGPMYFPNDIREIMISADGQSTITNEAVVIREIVVLPSPGDVAAPGCRLDVSLGDKVHAYASWNGDQYRSFPLSLVGPIDVGANTEIKAVLTPLPLGNNGTCSAELAVAGIVMPNF